MALHWKVHEPQLRQGINFKYQKLGKKLHNVTAKQTSEPPNSNSFYPGILNNTNFSHGELLLFTEVLNLICFKYTNWIQYKSIEMYQSKHNSFY
jgi:hypothetical protein